MKRADILVLIVNFRTPDLTIAAVQSILPEIAARGDAHVLIIDNGSCDGSADRLRDAIVGYDACSLLALQDNDGFAAGNNAGFEHYCRLVERRTVPRYVWLLNPDTIAHPDALTALADFVDAHPQVGLAGGQCLRADGTLRHSAFRFPTPASEFLTALDFGPLRVAMPRHDVLLPITADPMRADWLSGAHLLVRGEVFDTVGGLDPAYFLYFEETDFAARAAKAGFEAWHVPASVIMHLGGRSTGIDSGKDPRRPRYWFQSRARFFLRRHGVARTHLANLLWLLASPPGALLARLRGRPRYDPPLLWWDFLRYNYGPGGLMYRSAQVAA